MERIILEVDDTAGKMYRSFSEKGRQKFNQAINLVLKKAANDANAIEYAKFLDDISTEASNNGLTPEILESLLASDD